MLAWQRESWWTYCGALSSEVDRERYWEVVSHALRKHFSQSDLVSGIWYIHLISGTSSTMDNRALYYPW